jgi:hypothetical protein
MSNDDQSTPVMVRVPPDQLARLDEWRRRHQDLPGRPEAIRQLVDIGLRTPLPSPVRVHVPKSMRRVRE